MRVLVVEVAEVLGVVPQIPVEVAAALEYMEKVQAGLLGLLQAGTVLAQVAVLVAECQVCLKFLSSRCIDKNRRMVFIIRLFLSFIYFHHSSISIL